MAVKRDWRGNSTAREKVPTGYGLVENEPDQELAAMEQLPPAVRRVLAEVNTPISTISILDAYRRGYGESMLIAAIRRAETAEAVQFGTMPGDFWNGRRLHMEPPADKRDTAAVQGRPAHRGSKGRPRPRRMPRGPGSY